ncbi:hypothetical protein N9R81_05030 [Flavobacteriales bacterium]|nr:hypothetical protein [Flavobacteriales bacterium]
MRFLLPILLITVLGFSSCKKAVTTSPEFVGEWQGHNDALNCNYTITIPAEGKGRYYKLCDSNYVEASGIPYLRSKEQVLKIGKRELQILGNILPDGSTSYVPYEEFDSLRISLDGINFTKQD